MHPELVLILPMGLCEWYRCVCCPVGMVPKWDGRGECSLPSEDNKISFAKTLKGLCSWPEHAPRWLDWDRRDTCRDQHEWGTEAKNWAARAAYNNADIYLLDNPLSAVDAHTQASLFKAGFTWQLHPAIKFDCFHGLKFENISGWGRDEAVLHFLIWHDIIVVQDCVMEALADKMVVLVTHQVEFLPSINRIVVSIMWEIRCWDLGGCTVYYV